MARTFFCSQKCANGGCEGGATYQPSTVSCRLDWRASGRELLVRHRSKAIDRSFPRTQMVGNEEIADVGSVSLNVVAELSPGEQRS